MPAGRRCLVLQALLVSLVVATSGAQDPERRLITGIVRDSAHTPIPLAVIVSNANTKVASDDSGRFSLRVTLGAKLQLEVRRIGFRPVVLMVLPGPDTLIEVILTPLAQQLSAVEVLASQSRSLELRGFYKRMAAREKGVLHGEFITPEEIEKRNPPRITYMMDMVQGVRVVKKDMNPLHWEVLGSGGCTMTIFLDGMRLNRLTLTTNRMKDYLDEIVSPTSVAGIEVYRSATRAPAEYQSLAASCGVVLLWTK